MTTPGRKLLNHTLINVPHSYIAQWNYIVISTITGSVSQIVIDYTILDSVVTSSIHSPLLRPLPNQSMKILVCRKTIMSTFRIIVPRTLNTRKSKWRISKDLPNYSYVLLG